MAAVDLLNFSAHHVKAFGQYLGAKNLNIGCGRNVEPGFTNLDRKSGRGINVAFDLEDCRWTPIPFGDDEFDCIMASHVLEHLTNLTHVMRELHRILKPGGHLVVVAPHASSDDAWEDPTHVRAFTEGSWIYWDRRTYERDGHHGAYASDVDFIFEPVVVRLVPQDDVMTALGQVGLADPETSLRFGRRFLRNVVREIHAVLRKVEG